MFDKLHISGNAILLVDMYILGYRKTFTLNYSVKCNQDGLTWEDNTLYFTIEVKNELYPYLQACAVVKIVHNESCRLKRGITFNLSRWSNQTDCVPLIECRFCFPS